MPHFLLISTATFQAHHTPKTDIQSGFETVWRGLLLDCCQSVNTITDQLRSFLLLLAYVSINLKGLLGMHIILPATASKGRSILHVRTSVHCIHYASVLHFAVLEHLQQPRFAPRPKNIFAVRPSPGLTRRAALTPAAALKCRARAAPAAHKNTARAPL